MSTSAAICEFPETSARSRPSIELLPLEAVSTPCRSASYLILKRAVDLPLALILLLVAAPLLAALALIVRVSSPGPVLFRQKRLGRRGRQFHCYKFRTMRQDAESVLQRDPAIHARYVANGYKLPQGEDPRITKVGAFFRKTSLDELPQIFNVIAGDMSLVGPRPIVPVELKEYGHRAVDFLAALPGITGLWQVSGRSGLTYPERADVELEYVSAWSPILDLWILLRTLPAVLSRAGAH